MGTIFSKYGVIFISLVHGLSLYVPSLLEGATGRGYRDGGKGENTCSKCKLSKCLNCEYVSGLTWVSASIGQ